MDEQKTYNLIKELDTTSYTQKKDVYASVFSLGNFLSQDMNEKLVLISLIALTTLKMKQKDATMTPLKILLKITNQVEDNSAFYQMLESLAIIVEDFSYDCTKIDACGCKTSQEIINKIKEILNQWVPF